MAKQKWLNHLREFGPLRPPPSNTKKHLGKKRSISGCGGCVWLNTVPEHTQTLHSNKVTDRIGLVWNCLNHLNLVNFTSFGICFFSSQFSLLFFGRAMMYSVGTGSWASPITRKRKRKTFTNNGNDTPGKHFLYVFFPVL